jgi:DNA modification methylase
MYYSDLHAQLYNQDFRTNELLDESVQTAVTSPPYWGLRKYSGEQDLVWGDNHCEHEWGDLIPNPMVKSGKHGPASILTKTADAQHAVRKESNQGSFCSLCGAWKGAYGLEPTPEMYVQHTIEILREIRRVLRRNGVCFLNLGDSYAGSGSPGGDFRNGKGGDEYLRPYNRKGGTLKPKDLCLIPFRVAIAAQEDGWWVRSDIIWSKPNPMPESVTDRPTNSHEYILMLTKSARYYWDADAVRETAHYPNQGKWTQGDNKRYHNNQDMAARKLHEFVTDTPKPISPYSQRSYLRYVLRQPHQK